ncbi:hypothetical protein [Lacinutrix sp. Hel_I_90]|uniref:hypothetical protein n=1 Tax=Lacinutrix sp. Hel_I_90 TaxID=1249999 RepID=UPI0005C88136|nr:hypothetical protein [Lacinutrix sp. Hel_I_90]
MKNVIQLKESNFIKYLLIYFIVMLINNFIRTSNIVNSLVSESGDVVLFSGYMSSIISSMFVILLLIIVITICYFIKEIFFEEVKRESIFGSIKTVIILFIFIELFRVFLVYFVLLDEIEKFDFSGDVIQQLHNTYWYFYNSSINIFLIVVGGLFFGIEIYNKEHKIIPAIIFSTVFLCSFYLINVNIFDLLS